MTAQARTLGMAIHAELPLRSGAHAMFTHEIARVNEMIVRTNTFIAQVHMTRIASILRELAFMGVAASARCHPRSENIGSVGNVHMTSHAITVEPRDMCSVLEAQMRSGDFCALFGMGQAMTTAAFAIVMGFFMTIDAILFGGQVQGALFPRSGNSRMATIAMNAL
jgi:hypothetical protein